MSVKKTTAKEIADSLEFEYASVGQFFYFIFLKYEPLLKSK